MAEHILYEIRSKAKSSISVDFKIDAFAQAFSKLDNVYCHGKLKTWLENNKLGR